MEKSQDHGGNGASDGLLVRAKILREGPEKTVEAGKKGATRVVASPAADIEGQEDILAQLDAIVDANKITINPQLFKTTPRHQGWRLPLVINAVALLAIVAGVYISSYLFVRQESAQVVNDATLGSAEGKLLQQIRKESEANLAAKDQLISDIQSRLGKVQDEKVLLAQTMEEKLRQKELALRSQLEALLEVERQKLRVQGFSEPEIERRVKEIERQKTIEYSNALAIYKKQLEAEKARTEAELVRLQASYTNQLSQAQQERDTLLADSRKRETELRAQLAAKQASQNLHNPAGAKPVDPGQEAQSRALAAQDQMARLSQARDLEQATLAQIVGFYASVKDRIASGKWADALRENELMRQYLMKVNVGGSDTLQKQRDAWLSVTEALEQLISSEQTRADAGTLVKSATILNNAEVLGQAGQDAEKTGNTTKAADAYGKLLGLIPGGQKASSFFVTQEQVKGKDATEKLALDYKNRLEGVRKEFENKPDPVADEAKMKMGLDLENATKDIADLKKKLESQTKRADKLEADAKRQAAENKVAADKLAAREKELSVLKSQPAASTTAPGAILSAGAIATPSVPASSQPFSQADRNRIAKLEADLAKAKNAELDLGAFSLAYGQYLQKLRGLDTRKPEDLALAKQRLDSFLSAAEVRKYLPGLSEGLRIYDQALSGTTQKAAAATLADKLVAIAAYPNAKARLEALKKEEAKTTEPSIKDFYRALEKLIE